MDIDPHVPVPMDPSLSSTHQKGIELDTEKKMKKNESGYVNYLP